MNNEKYTYRSKKSKCILMNSDVSGNSLSMFIINIIERKTVP